MRPPHAPTSSHRRLIERVLGAGFDRRLLSLRQVYARRLRSAGRLTCRVHGQLELPTTRVGKSSEIEIPGAAIADALGTLHPKLPEGLFSSASSAFFSAGLTASRTCI